MNPKPLPLSVTMSPNFRLPETLLAHVRHTMAFYDPRCVDPSGGFYHFTRMTVVFTIGTPVI